MEKLKEIIDLRGIGYPVKATLVKRTKRKAIYVRSDGYYEIFKIKVSPAETVFGKSYPEREVYPCNEDFGFSAWCCASEEGALKRYKNLV